MPCQNFLIRISPHTRVCHSTLLQNLTTDQACVSSRPPCQFVVEPGHCAGSGLCQWMPNHTTRPTSQAEYAWRGKRRSRGRSPGSGSHTWVKLTLPFITKTHTRNTGRTESLRAAPAWRLRRRNNHPPPPPEQPATKKPCDKPRTQGGDGTNDPQVRSISTRPAVRNRPSHRLPPLSSAVEDGRKTDPLYHRTPLARLLRSMSRPRSQVRPESAINDGDPA